MGRVQTDDPGPMIANVHGYKPFGKPDDPNRQREPNALITITGWFEDDPSSKWQDGDTQQQWEARAYEKFIREAGEIYNVLSNNLPGGTLHQLLIRMLQGKLNLHVVSDAPDILPDRLNIEKLALIFVQSPDNWESYTDCKGTDSASLPAEWFNLCAAVEAKYGTPKVEDEPPTPEVTELIEAFERDVVEDEEKRRVTAIRASLDYPGCLLIQVNQDDAEWYLVQPKELTAMPF